MFYVEDTSRNGVFVNSFQNRLVHDQPYPLRSGDRILIDPYEIRVSIEAEEGAQAERSGNAASSPPSRDPFSDRFDPLDPFAPGSADAAEELDPLELLDPERDSRRSQRVPPAEPLDRDSPFEAHYGPPAVSAPPAAVPDS